MASILSFLFSLPAIPLLLLTSSFSSPSTLTTSLNLLFLHLTWSTLVLSHPPIHIEVLGTLLMRLLFLLLPSLLLLCLDLAIPSLTSSWRSRTARRRSGGGNTAAWKTVAVATGNILLAAGVQWGMEYFLTKVVRVRSAVRMSKFLPSPTGAVGELVMAEGMREVGVYVLHRYLLHQRVRRGGGIAGWFSVARQHQSWAHGGGGGGGYCGDGGCGVGAFTSHYDHPVPYLLLHFLPTYIPAAVFLRMHALTWFVYTAFISILEVVSYSGYTEAPVGYIPLGFVLGWMARRTDGHFASGGRKAFGVWGVADWLGGTRVEAGGEEYLKETWGDIAEGFMGDGGSGGREKGRKRR